jgi:hypothetical protein
MTGQHATTDRMAMGMVAMDPLPPPSSLPSKPPGGAISAPALPPHVAKLSANNPGAFSVRSFRQMPTCPGKGAYWQAKLSASS